MVKEADGKEHVEAVEGSSVGLFGEIRKALEGLWSLVVGLSVTGNQFYRPAVTVHYPRKTVDNLETYRGPVELVPSEKDPALSKCILCGMCTQTCPSGCIEIESHQEEEPDQPESEAKAAPAGAADGAEGEKKAPPKKKKKIKVMDKYLLKFHLCSLCGQCVQVCPVNALRFSHEVYLAGTSRSDFEFDLLARLRSQRTGGTGSKQAGSGKA